MTMDDGGSELHEENTKSLEDDEKGVMMSAKI